MNSDPPCFECGESKPTRPIEVVVSRAHTSGSADLSTTVYARRPVCADCIARDVENAKLALKVGGLAIAGMSLISIAIALIPFLAIAAVIAVMVFATIF